MSEAERSTFRQLLKVAGVGARTALAVLSGLSVPELVDAVTRQETGRLTKIPGIGKKTAERLLLELKDKMGVEVVLGASGPRPVPASSDVLHALIALGYNEREALAAMKSVADGASVADGIKQALKALSKA
jgi:Holliday junction DNA helicase RuvA